jgi:hypothetical protein
MTIFYSEKERFTLLRYTLLTSVLLPGLIFVVLPAVSEDVRSDQIAKSSLCLGYHSNLSAASLEVLEHL